MSRKVYGTLGPNWPKACERLIGEWLADTQKASEHSEQAKGEHRQYEKALRSDAEKVLQEYEDYCTAKRDELHLTPFDWSLETPDRVRSVLRNGQKAFPRLLHEWVPVEEEPFEGFPYLKTVRPVDDILYSPDPTIREERLKARPVRGPGFTAQLDAWITSEFDPSGQIDDSPPEVARRRTAAWIAREEKRLRALRRRDIAARCNTDAERRARLRWIGY